MLINAVDIADYLEADLIGSDIAITQASPLNECIPGSLSFINKSNYGENTNIEVLYIVTQDKSINHDSKARYIKVDNPRLAFAKAVNRFFTTKQGSSCSASASIAPTAHLEENVSIGEFCVIGDNVSIGRNTIINHNVIIFDNTKIGENCYLKSGTIIGEDGFGFDFEEDGTPIRIPHIGKVIIGNNVEIGAKCTIARGTLANTIIEDNVKIDDQVHIAHNCFIGEKTLITACAEISGSVHIGKKCWIGPNVSIMQKLTIGEESLIGLGAIITHDIPAKKKIMGLESLELRELIKMKKRIGLN